jgi:hypothetical protein
MNQTIHGGADRARLVREYDATAPGDALQGATFEGTRLVVASDAYLLRVVPESGRLVDRLETFPEPGGLAFDGSCLWQHKSGSLQQIDGRMGFVVQTVTPELTEVTGLECRGGDLLVLHAAGRRLMRLQVDSLGLTEDAVVVGERRTDVALRGLAWVAGQLWSSTGDELVRIDPGTAGTLERLLLPGTVEVCDLTVDSAGCFWCVDGTSPRVRVLARPRANA